MNLMNCRLIHLKQTFLGYIKTGIPLIEFDNQQLVHSFTFDDIGIYIIIPKIVAWFNVSIEQAINQFFYGILLIPCLIGIIGFLKYYSSLPEKLIACAGIVLLTRQAYGLGDVYLAYFSCVVALVPWALYFSKKRCNSSLLIFIFLSGIVIGFFHYIRSYSGMGTFLFISVLFGMTLSLTWKQWIKLFLAFSFGAALPVTYFNQTYNNSLKFAQEQTNAPLAEKTHVFWHNIYIGFGFLQQGNPDNITYDDSEGEKKVKKIAPNLTIENTKEYERILKNEVINLIKNHWQFFIFTLFAKIGILLLFFLEYANFGIIASLLYPKPWHLEIPFFIGLGLYSIFPVLVIPLREYALGFISFATIYGIVSINYALEKGFFKNLIAKFNIFPLIRNI